ncbi:FtsK/SpoIIIE domain-containing protein [Actinoplanes sp. NEAU-A12]|uniref:FtsK/SpoIIIE domain-containing protein n=1 Tax=Actinoplanes sandaracinus TaxID=3045177 RepID=A0ABT6WYH1_9ACTN|nr:FtsK/SpoIIIE domain-containing protein [Actinoplanes sandaracinus]MDI6104800.1 FtsK/SpoIIIE domain-containing protein [Actinoplanes sandaracinus]
MQIVFRADDGDHELDVELRNPDATLGDLVRAVRGTPVPPSVAVDDRVVPSSCLVVESGLHEGGILTAPPDEPSGPAAANEAGFELVAVAGTEAGRVFPLVAGRSSLGRDRAGTIVLDHPTVSRHHCEIELAESGTGTIVDPGSGNGTLVDGTYLRPVEAAEVSPGCVIQAGALGFTIRPVAATDRPRGLDLRRPPGLGGTVSFNRPPRPARAPIPGPIEVPTEPGEPAKPHFSVVSFVGPLCLAVLLMRVSAGKLALALVAVLSPFLVVGIYLESRRRSQQGAKRDRRRYETEVGEFERRVGETGVAERSRLRELCPDPGEILRRAALPSVRLWERRTQHEDFLRLFAGLADLPWQPPVTNSAAKLPPETATALESSRLRAAPVCVDLSHGGVVGVVGDRAAALATARSLVCQAAVHQGPADLTIGVFVDPGREPDWEWCKWLPHTRGTSGGDRWLSAQRDTSDTLLRALAGGAGTGTVLVVLDSDVLTEGKNAPARDLLSAADDRGHHASAAATVPVAGIVVSSSADRLPAACNTIIEVLNSDGDAIVRRPEEGAEIGDVLLAGLAVPTARTCARNLARFEDPELHQPGAGLPDSVRLLPLLEMERIDAESIRKQWRLTGPTAGPVAPLGVTERGVFNLDLVRDGPHGLVGGTTGSGKSELLRSLVAALAVRIDPTHLTFILMDFKGGAAFDECARLPHTVGMVTDLDEQLAERALQSLEAEVQYRERTLRAAGADNLQEYLALHLPEPLPRLVVVIDEFATLAKENPEFLSSLVSVAQRGRTLGVHMILATQRPAGAINDNIRTNTNLRIALRVQDAADSVDVIDRPDAAALSRHLPGRAYIRLGPGEIVPIQTALVTCVTDENADTAVDVAPFVFGPALRPKIEEAGSAVDPAGNPEPQRSDLARLVDAAIAANRAENIPPPRRPWPEPLPAHIDVADLVAAAVPTPGAARAVVALADDPRRQTQYPAGWDPVEGNLLIFGIPGSGTTTALADLALSLATVLSPEELEVYALDFGAGDLKALEGLPHTGSVILADDRERQVRLVRHLRAELDRRRGGAPRRRTLVLIDNLSAMRAEFDDTEGLELIDEVTRVYADGTDMGISFAVTADRLNTAPNAWMSVTTHKWLFRLPDPYDYVSAGLTRKNVPQPIPGRAVMVPSGLQIQFGRPTPSLMAAVAAVAARYPQATRLASPIGMLPAEVSFASLGAISDLTSEPWRIPIGMRQSDLGVAHLELYEGDHALVTGPARSGKSLALWTIAASLRTGQQGGELHLVATGGRRCPLRECPALDRFATAGGEATAVFASIRTVTGPVVVLIDDAESFDDADSAIAGLFSSGRPDLHVIAAGRSDSLRTLYGHWTSTVRRSKTGLLLRPNVDLDGDLLGVTLPRRTPVRMTIGRGYAANNGELDMIQVAAPLIGYRPPIRLEDH